MVDHASPTAATSEASVAVDVAADGIYVQSIQQLLARIGIRLTVKAVVVAVSRASATTRGRNGEGSIREAVLPGLLLLAQTVHVEPIIDRQRRQISVGRMGWLGLCQLAGCKNSRAR